MRRRVAILALVLAVTPLASRAADGGHSPAALRAHVEFLADDLMEGRKAGTRGHELAARYVASRFAAIGLAPASAQGWYQPVPLVEARLAPAGPAVLHVGTRRFEHKDGTFIGASFKEARLDLSAEVVFAGYCFDSPAQGFDDFAGLDVRGKVVACLTGFPKGMASDVGAQLSTRKSLMAQERGAVGVLSVYTRQAEKVLPWKRLLEMADEPATAWVQADGSAYRQSPAIRAVATLHGAAAEALFEGAPRTLATVLDEADREGGRPRGFALAPRVRFEIATELKKFSSPNVVGLLEGGDPARRGELVVLVAHLDHLGVKDGPAGPVIHNGALDNAAGVATLIEVARAMAAAPRRPARSVLFAAVTAEELGLLGSQYLAKHPVVRGGTPVAVVGLDAPILLYDFTDVIAFGAEHSTLGPAIARATASAGVASSPDPLPEQGLFARSDHFSFVKEGVPAVFLVTGFANGGKEAFGQYLGKHYHRESDTAKLPIDWRAAAKFAWINELIAREVADAPATPRWYGDSPFGRTYAPDAPKAPRQP